MWACEWHIVSICYWVHTKHSSRLLKLFGPVSGRSGLCLNPEKLNISRLNLRVDFLNILSLTCAQLLRQNHRGINHVLAATSKYSRKQIKYVDSVWQMCLIWTFYLKTVPYVGKKPDSGEVSFQMYVLLQYEHTRSTGPWVFSFVHSVPSGARKRTLVYVLLEPIRREWPIIKLMWKPWERLPEAEHFQRNGPVFHIFYYFCKLVRLTRSRFSVCHVCSCHWAQQPSYWNHFRYDSHLVWIQFSSHDVPLFLMGFFIS